MADGATFTLTGATELQAQLKALPERVANNVMRGALFAGARVIRDAARKLVPILDLEKWRGPHEPGQLLAAIVAARRRPRGAHPDEISAQVGILDTAFYGRFVEFGTSHARAYPFMRPAADEAAGTAAQEVIDYAAARLEKEAQSKT